MKKELRILILEDLPADAELNERELRKANLAFTFHRVETKEAYLEALADFAPDVILSDYGLPQFNGLEALRLLKEHKLDTPFILVTGSLTEEVAVECMKEGAADYIIKTSLKRLPSAVSNALEKRDARSAKDAAFAALRQVNDELERRVEQRTVELAATNLYLQDEIVERRRAEAALLTAHNELELRVKQRTAELVESNKSLQESETRFHSAFEYAPIGIGLALPDGSWLQVNNSFCEIIGYSKEEIQGMAFQTITHPDDLAASLVYQRRMLSGEFKTCQMEKRYKHKDGHVVWGQTSVSLVLDAENNPVYFISQIQDITGRKHAEVALMESEQRYRFLGEGIPHHVWTAQPDGTHDYFNRRALEYFGRRFEDMLGNGWQDIIHPDDLPACVERWTNSLQNGAYYEAEFRLKRADGTYRWHSGRATAGRDAEGRIVKWFGTNTDINNQKLGEEALRASEEQLRQSQKLDAIGQLAGGIAHDFNNLLTVITGYSDLTLRRFNADDPLRRNIEEIKKSGARAAALTRQLLAFSRKQVMQPAVLDLNFIVEDMDKMLQRLIGEDINILTVCDPALGQVKTDAGQIEQVIMNLAVNARDAMRAGGKLTIETSNVELSESYAQQHIPVSPGRYVMLAVSDNGCGMNPEVKARIYEPFFTTKELGKGTGLGLSTVYGIVKQSGGFIWVYSEVGQGTTFKIYLPRVDEAVETVVAIESPVAFQQATETVLLVEDEEGVRRFLREVLEIEGYRVLETSSGNDALQFSRNHQGEIHLMLSDVVMPEMSGRELAEHIVLHRPEIKVLFMSGYTDEAIIRHGVLSPGVDFLGKPFTPDVIARKVREVLDTHRQEITEVVEHNETDQRLNMPLNVLTEAGSKKEKIA